MAQNKSKRGIRRKAYRRQFHPESRVTQRRSADATEGKKNAILAKGKLHPFHKE
jgi:hypothetical protein